MQFYKACPRWLREVYKNNETTYKERWLFTETEHFKRTIHAVSARLGFMHPLSSGNVMLVHEHNKWEGITYTHLTWKIHLYSEFSNLIPLVGNLQIWPKKRQYTLELLMQYVSGGYLRSKVDSLTRNSGEWIKPFQNPSKYLFQNCTGDQSCNIFHHISCFPWVFVFQNELILIMLGMLSH